MSHCPGFGCGMLALVAALGCRGEGKLGGIPRAEVDPNPVIAREIAPLRPISPETDGEGFAGAANVRFDGERMLVLENRNSRCGR